MTWTAPKSEPKPQAAIDEDYARAMEEQRQAAQFINWDEYFTARKLPPPHKEEDSAIALQSALFPSGRAEVPDGDGYPVTIYGRRTGRGRVVWSGKGAWWRNALERLSAPVQWLRRVLFVAWVLTIPTARQLRTPRLRRKLVRIHRTPFLLPPGAVTDPAPLYQVVPVLNPAIVRRLPKWVLRRLHLITAGYDLGAGGCRGLQPLELYTAGGDEGELVIARASSGALGTTQRTIDRNEEPS